MLTQLVLTIGKARTFNEILPPPFLGCFDNEKIAFIPYSEIQDIFYQNDFNWKVAPSDKETREFKLVYTQIEKIINRIPWQTYIFYFDKDEKDLRQFIRENFIVGKTETSLIQIDKNNFLVIYNKWLKAVKPTIQVDDWGIAKKNGIIDGYFYLADLLSDEGKTLTDKLYVLLENDHYVLKKGYDISGLKSLLVTGFSDNQKAYKQFWAKYKRPPEEEYWEYIIKRQDLLVPQDIREQKGSFYTPDIWVELSQKYLADTFGKDWQDEYYIWDCAAGTGNLLIGLVNKYNIWASTIDKADVDVMKQRIENGANLLESHVFQFDFLNDDFSKLPQGLQEIINDPKRRKKLLIYINPPYAEAGSTATRVGTRENKTGVATKNKIHAKYSNELGKARNELFAQFLTKIYFEISGCKIGTFSTLKELVSPNFSDFRKFFLAKLKKSFMVPANTFDNVNGNFQIGFNVWDTEEKKYFRNATIDVYDAKGIYYGKKTHRNEPNRKYINDWIKNYIDKKNTSVAKLCFVSSDFQNQAKVQICSTNKKIIAHDVVFNITISNMIMASIYFAVRKVIKHTWINHRDQFLFPNKKWEKDLEFQNDCLAYTIFNNNISTKFGVNHWIPFMEDEIDAKDVFASHTLIRFISGKEIQNSYVDLFDNEKIIKREFSETAKKVFNAGRELWKYYHAAISSPFGGGREGAVNASLYDIKEYFKGRNEKGNMNQKSTDLEFNRLDKELTEKLKLLAQKIEPKVYEYGFLME